MTPSDDSPTHSDNGRPPADPTPPLPPPGSTAPPGPPGPPPASTTPLGGPADDGAGPLGTRPGRYRCGDDFKGGGLGRVYRAEDTVVRRTVAVKRLRPDRSVAAFGPRFVHEARVTGQLEHPNIVPLYDLFESADGPAYAMRYLDGETLADAARGYHERRAVGADGPLELPRLLDAFGLVCRAVEFAHRKGVLHRDLKGQNILLGRYGEVCLADWGLAKWVGDPDGPGDPSPLSPSLAAATEPGAVMGTPQFMAPELARRQPASVATDVYGLGAVLYQLLTAAVPHAGSTPKEVLSRLEAGEVVRPARERNPSLHPALDAICHKALSHDPAARYPSAAALADDVRAYLAGEPVGAYPEPWAARAGRWVRRHKAGVLAGVVALAVAAVGASVAAVLVWQEKERTRRERDRAEANFAIADAMTNDLIRVVTAEETGLTRSTRGVPDRQTAVAGAVAASERFLSAQPDDPDHLRRTAVLLRFAGNLARLTDDLAGAEGRYAASIQLQERLLAGRPADPHEATALALARTDAAAVAELGGRLGAAAEWVGQAVAHLDQLTPADRVTPDAQRARGLALAGRAGIRLKVGRPTDAEADAATAAELFAALAAGLTEDRHPLDPVFRGLALTTQAEVRRELAVAAGGRDYSAALAAHAEATEVYRQAVLADTGVDGVFNSLSGQVEQARTRLLAGPATDAPAHLNGAVDGLRQVAASRPAVHLYRHRLAVGLTVRGQARAGVVAAPGRARPAADFLDPTIRGLAAADFHEAASLLEPLILASPARPAYRAAYADAWAGLARLATARDGREVWYYQAWSAYTSAVNYDPDNVLYRRRYEALRAEAAAAGVDLTRRPAVLAPAR